MIKLIAVAFAMFAIWSATTSAFGQSKSLEGNQFPVYYDRDGVQHYPMYGYYGPMAPAMPGATKTPARTSKVAGRGTRARVARPRAVPAKAATNPS